MVANRKSRGASRMAAREITVDLSNLAHVVNPIFVPAFQSMARYLVLYGGSGSGKSYAAAQKTLTRVLTEDDHRILCVRNTAASVSKSQFPLLKDEMTRWGMRNLFKVNESAGREKITSLLNGNEILFSGLDDVEKLKSIAGITSIWIEEASEVTVEDFRELNRRLRGYSGKNASGSRQYMQIILSFNPISALHWLKSYFFDTRRKNALVIHSTYKDNKFIDPQYGAELELLRDESQYEYDVYVLGKWGIVGGTFFSGQAVSDRYEQIKDLKPLQQGYFEHTEQLHSLTDIRWVHTSDGQIKIYKEPRPGVPYVIGADTAGEGSDYNVAHVIDNISGEQVAVIRQQHDEDRFAMQLYSLGMHYNKALIGAENNFSTHVTKTLERLRYPKMYVREQAPDAFTGKLTDRFGFVTTKANRMDILGSLRAIVRERAHLINDLDTLSEMTTFIVNERGRPEAASGHHDDCIMSLAITHAIRGQQSCEMSQTVFDISDLPEDVREDYNNASAEMRQYMLRKWGFIDDDKAGD